MKYFFKYTIIIAIAWFGGNIMSFAQTIHTIVFCNTIDYSIGKSMEIELRNMKNQVQKWAEVIDYDTDHHELPGNICTRDNLKAIVDNMNVEPDDVILTFYGGHGSHAENDPDPWPQYLMNSGFENQGNWVPMAEFKKWVVKKNARLSIIISNCCNVVQKATTKKPLWAMGGDYTSLDNIKSDNFKKLFAAKGLVMATSSKVPEPSWCCVPDGGLFTCDFIEAMNMVGSGSISADWKSVLDKAYNLCSNRDIVDRDGEHHKQHPYFEIDSSVGPIPPGTDVPKSTDPLEQALLDIVNKNIDRSTRLAMIPTLVNKHFGKYSKVLTVGTDLETGVEYENPQDFLRRICLSPYIKRVNIINRDGGILTVHELRTQ